MYLLPLFKGHLYSMERETLNPGLTSIQWTPLLALIKWITTESLDKFTEYASQNDDSFHNMYYALKLMYCSCGDAIFYTLSSCLE